MKKAYILSFLPLLISTGLKAQTVQEARALVQKGAYEAAMPVFEKEVKRKPKDGNANYWYGTCVYYTEGRQAAVPYLEIAEKSRFKEASYLLAEAALERRAFKRCLRHIDNYLIYNTGKHQSEIAGMIRLCERFPQKLPYTEDILILDSIIVHKDKCLNAIKLHPACGKLYDWNGRLAYVNEKGDRCYSSDSVNGQGLDIFIYNKMPDSWEKEKLDSHINSPANEAYPYLLSDGVTIYFASDNANGWGGYDLYVSRYNAVTESYFNAESLPFPFNSTANDYAYIVDEVIGRAYLISDRRQAADSLIVYTFIPNAQRNVVKDKSDAELLRMAEIISIADTWRGRNVDSIAALQEKAYQEALLLYQEAKEQALEEESQSEAIAVLIYGQTVYYAADDCRSVKGKELYGQYVKIRQQKAQLEKTLENNRKLYASADDAKQRIRTGERIRQAEWNLISLDEQLKACLQELRQVEIPYLQK